MTDSPATGSPATGSPATDSPAEAAAARSLARLLAIMARLRDPAGGCPWDLEQNFATIAPYTIEEAYEVADAIERNDMAALKDELGDLLLLVVFHAGMAEEGGHFALDRKSVVYGTRASVRVNLGGSRK